jgi:hypothetical protein
MSGPDQGVQAFDSEIGTPGEYQVHPVTGALALDGRRSGVHWIRNLLPATLFEFLPYPLAFQI